MNLAPETPKIKRIYDLGGGMNSRDTNEALHDNVSPYLRNTRYQKRGTSRTRKGPGYYSDPIGEVQDTSKTTASDGNQTISVTTKQAAKFFPTVTQNLTKLDLQLRTGTGAGIIRIELWSDNSGTPGTLLGESSISGASVPASYAYVSARFLSAPSVVAFTNYWIVAYVQSDGSGSYQWASTSSGTTSTTNISGAGWTSTGYDLTFKTYSAPNNPILGGIRFTKSTRVSVTLIANKTGVYTVNDTTGAVTQIFSGNTSATFYRFEVVNDTAFWVDGYDAPQQYDGSSVIAVPGSPPIASDVRVHKNRLFFQSASDPTRYVFSEATDFATYLSVNFFYVPSPKSPEPGMRMVSMQDNLFIWTRGSKWALYGSDLSSLTLRRSMGLAGTTNGDSVITFDNRAYFVSDNGIYGFNGTTDEILSDNPQAISSIQPDFLAADATKMTTVISGNYLYVFYPSAGTPYNDRAFVYDLIQGVWFIDDAAYFSRAFTYKSGTGEKLVLGSSRVGQVYYASVQDSDLGAPITFDYRTQYETYNFPSQYKQIKRLYLELTGQQSNYNLSVYVDYDFADTPRLVQDVPVIKSGPVWGQFVWGAKNWGASGDIQPRLNVTGKFRSRQYRFYCRGVDQPQEIIGYEDYYYVRNAR